MKNNESGFSLLELIVVVAIMAVVMWALPLAALTLAGPLWLALPGCAVPLGLRLALHGLTRRRFGVAYAAPIWLVPLRELLCFAIWAASFASREVVWRDRMFRVAPSGLMAAPGEAAP